jgi:hypothetical protein
MSGGAPNKIVLKVAKETLGQEEKLEKFDEKLVQGPGTEICPSWSQAKETSEVSQSPPTPSHLSLQLFCKQPLSWPV